MFRERDQQTTFLESTYLLPEDKLARAKQTWAEIFRTRVVKLINERTFAPLFHATEGRPNKPVEIVLGTLLIKDLFDYTDRETLEQLEFNLLWHHALWLTPEDSHCCQKTLHNFRVGLLKHDGARLAFEQLTAGVIETLGINVARQRLDSTHIVSNIATLTRLGLFCETIRTFLRSLSRQDAALLSQVPAALVARYLKDDGTDTHYDDARTSKARRRLDVCARDLYRLLDRFRGTAVAQQEQYQLLQRLFDDQCEVAAGEDDERDQDADDAGEGGVSVIPVEPKTIKSSSLQTPHDPDATYSGHKGIGYEVQISESIAAEEGACQVITGVAVTDSCASDANALIPMLDDLQRRSVKPGEITVDTAYGSGENAYQAARRGTELVAPVPGRPQTNAQETSDEPAALTAADFNVDLQGHERSTCPAGHQAELEVEDEDRKPGVVDLFFATETCEQCPLRALCPARLSPSAGAFHFEFDHRKAGLERRRKAEADGTFGERYKIRAGIEATNSELKRRHGLGRLRVRGRPRVELAVYLKAAACNIKRMIAHLQGAMRPKLAAAGC